MCSNTTHLGFSTMISGNEQDKKIDFRENSGKFAGKRTHGVFEEW